uniref:G-protein coupled receptors family 1 profile domain-containing protein n=1 Tax=Eptatretus burgeri TaxID=7764 RepID=A0A8C4QW54_EPTBU
MQALAHLWRLVIVTSHANGEEDMRRSHTEERPCPQMTIALEVFLILGVLGLLENVLVIVAIARSRHLHSPMYYFMCSLATADLLVSSSNIWETIMLELWHGGVLNIDPQTLERIDNVFDSMICTSFVASMCSLLAIAADRYVTIFYALRYHCIMTARNVGLAIAAIWVGCTACGVVFIAYHESTAVVLCLVATFFTLLALMAVLYMHMFLLARSHDMRDTFRELVLCCGTSRHQGRSQAAR